MAAELRLSWKADLASAFGAQRPAAITIGPAGEALALLADEPEAALVHKREEQHDWASFPRTRTRRPVAGEVLRHDGTNAYRTVLSDLAVAFPHLQPLPVGEILVVGARCHLGKTALEDLQELPLVLPGGSPLDSGEVLGRGAVLHVFAGNSWYTLDVRSLP